MTSKCEMKKKGGQPWNNAIHTNRETNNPFERNWKIFNLHFKFAN